MLRKFKMYKFFPPNKNYFNEVKVIYKHLYMIE